MGKWPLNYLVPHAKQATHCPHGRKKQSLGASKQIAQRCQVSLLVSSSPKGFPSMEPSARKSRSSSSCGMDSYDEPRLEQSSSFWESNGSLWGAVSSYLTPALSSCTWFSLLKKCKAKNTSKSIPTAVRNCRNSQ